MTKKKPSSAKKKGSGSIVLIMVFILAFACGAMAVWFYMNRRTDIPPKNAFQIDKPEGFASFGIDVSHHQGPIDWEQLFFAHQLDSVIDFVYCKATEGVDHVDTQWENNRRALLQLNKPHGAYHFFSTKTDPLIQAQHFLRHWRPKQNDLPPVLDVEVEADSDPELLVAVKIWLDAVEHMSGMRPIIYTSLHFYEQKFRYEFNDHLFWIAAYSRRPACLNEERIIHWQYSDAGELPVFETKIDFNVSKVTLEPISD